MKYLAIALLTATICITSCKKQEEELPVLTTEGKNFLACKVDGAMHIYTGLETTFHPDGVNYQPYIDKIRLSGSSSEYDDMIDMFLPNPKSIKTDTTYYFSTETSDCYANRYTGNNGRPYRTDKNSGWVKFSRLDTLVASGTFAFTGYRNGDSTVITEGRFDLKNNY